MTQTTRADLDRPTLTLDDARRLVAQETSLGSRVVTCLLLCGALAMTTVLTSLWATEPDLPVRTQVAFGVLTVLGASWSLFFGWVMARRTAFYARHSVVAGRLATFASLLFVAGALLVAALDPALRTTGFFAAAVGTVFVAVAVLMLRGAVVRYRELAALRGRLEQELVGA